MNSNQNPRDNRDLYETPWCKAGWKVTFNMLTTFPLCPRKKTKRPTEKGCAPPTDEPNCYICLRFFDVVLRHFLLWLSLMPHACHVEAYSYICLHFFYAVLRFFWGEFRSQGSEAWLFHSWIASCGRNRSTCVQSVVQAQWVVSLACRSQLLEPIHQRLDHPNPTKHVGRNRCLQHKKDSCLKTAHRQRPGTLKNTAFKKMVYSSKKAISRYSINSWKFMSSLREPYWERGAIFWGYLEIPLTI